MKAKKKGRKWTEEQKQAAREGEMDNQLMDFLRENPEILKMLERLDKARERASFTQDEKLSIH